MARKRLKTLKRNKWRYLSITLGFFLLVAPFALLINGINALGGTNLPADVHTLCYRVPLAWLSGPGAFLLFPMVATIFVLAIIGIALIFGPIFCGWLCPVGGLSEAVSRLVPLPDKYRLQIKDTRVTAGLRYGFFVGFIIMAFFIGEQLVAYQFGGVTCRYCATYLLESGTNALLGTGPAVDPWNAGIYLTLVAWLVIGGIAMVGGRGWCLFFCPLGAMSGLAHKCGSSIGLPAMRFNEEKCRHCKKCSAKCPMMAIRLDHEIEASLCIGCRECAHACPGKAYSYGRKRPLADPQPATGKNIHIDAEGSK
jgi:ferredoxin-type protein NapH